MEDVHDVRTEATRAWTSHVSVAVDAIASADIFEADWSASADFGNRHPEGANDALGEEERQSLADRQ